MSICSDCGEEGCGGDCLYVDGRCIQCVAEYASTCDGCGELHCHINMAMDTETQLGYCPACEPEARASGLLKIVA